MLPHWLSVCVAVCHAIIAKLPETQTSLSRRLLSGVMLLRLASVGRGILPCAFQPPVGEPAGTFLSYVSTVSPSPPQPAPEPSDTCLVAMTPSSFRCWKSF